MNDIFQQKCITCRMVLHDGVTNSYAGCQFYLGNSAIPFCPDIIRVDSVCVTPEVSNRLAYQIRSNICDDEILLSFNGQPYLHNLGTVLKPNKPLSDIRIQCSSFGTGGEGSPDTNVMGGTWTLAVQLTLIQLKKS